MLSFLLKPIFGSKVAGFSTPELLARLGRSFPIPQELILEELSKRQRDAVLIGEALLEAALAGRIEEKIVGELLVALGPDSFKNLERKIAKASDEQLVHLKELFSWFSNQPASRELSRLVSQVAPPLTQPLLAESRPSKFECGLYLLTGVIKHMDAASREQVFRNLLDVLVSHSEENALEFELALGEMAPHLPEHFSESCKSLARSGSAITRMRAVELLACLAEEDLLDAKRFLKEELFPELLRGLEGASQEVVRENARIISSFSEIFERPEPALLSALRAADRDTRPALLYATLLTPYEESPEVKFVEQMLDSVLGEGADATGEPALDIVDCITSSNGYAEKGLPILVRYLASKDSKLRRACIFALHTLETPEAKKLIKDLTRDPDPKVAEEAKLWDD